MSDLRRFCEKVYRDFIEKADYPNEFKKFLRVHERVPTFIDNLTREFSNPNLKVSKQQIESAVIDMTKIFVQAAQQKAEERVMSPVKQMQLKERAARAKEMKKLADALDKQGERNEQVTQDQKGNTTSRARVEIGEEPFI